MSSCTLFSDFILGQKFVTLIGRQTSCWFSLPVKKVKYGGEFNKESMMMYNKAHMNDMSPAAGSIGQGY